MTALTKEQILARRPRKTKLVEVKDLDGEVLISVMTAREKEEFEAWVLSTRGSTTSANIRARLVSLTVVDETGQRMFTDADVEAIGNLNSHVVEKLFNEIISLNAFTDKDAEQLLKNSEATPVAGSNSV